MNTIIPNDPNVTTLTESISDDNRTLSAEHQQFQFEIQVLNAKESFVRASAVSVGDLTQIIEQSVIPRSKWRTALFKYKWSIWFIVNKSNTVEIKDNEHLKYLIEICKLSRYSLQIRFRDELEFDGRRRALSSNEETRKCPQYTEWKKTEQNRSLPIIDALNVEVVDHKLKVTVPGFEQHEYGHEIEYFVEKIQSRDDNQRYQPNDVQSEEFKRTSTVNSSPFYVQNLWPFESYRIKVRYKSTLFPERNENPQFQVESQYAWSEWNGPHKIQSAPLNCYRDHDDDQKQNEKKHLSTVETYDHDQLCEWIEHVFRGNENGKIEMMESDVISTDPKGDNMIWGTAHEHRVVFPSVLKLIRASKLNGSDLVLKEPSSYVHEELMQIHQKLNANTNNDDDDRKDEPIQPMPEVSNQQRDELRASIIELIRTETTTNTKIDDSITDSELDQILNRKPIQSLLQKKGMDLKNIRLKLFGKRKPPSFAASFLGQFHVESVMWRLRQMAFTEVDHPVGALIDNPYCIYIWVYFLKQPRCHYAIEQSEDTVFMPLRPCMGTSEVHLYHTKYFTRTDPSHLDISFFLCEKQNESSKFMRLKVDGDFVRFSSLKRRHVIFRAYNDGSGMPSIKHSKTSSRNVLMTQQRTEREHHHRQDMVQKVKDMKDWKSLEVPKKRKFKGKKARNLPYFECLLQFCFSNIGHRVSLSSSIDVILQMHSKNTSNGKQGLVQQSIQMITEKLKSLNTQNLSISSSNDSNDQKWLNLSKRLFHLYWIPNTNFSNRIAMTMDVLQQLLNGEYGPPQRVIKLFRIIIKPVANAFLDTILRAIERMQHDLSTRYQYLLWYNLINSICHKGNYPKQPKLSRNIKHLNLESEYIRMIQIDFNIQIHTEIERKNPLENEAFWIFKGLLLQTHRRQDAGDLKYQIYNKMCYVLSVFQSNGYSEALKQHKDDIILILLGQKRPFEASVAMYHVLQPKGRKDIDQMVNIVSHFVSYLDPMGSPDSVDKLVDLMASNKAISVHRGLIESILQNPWIRWNEALIQYLVPTLKAQHQSKKKESKSRKTRTASTVSKRECDDESDRKLSVDLMLVIFDEFWKNYNLLKVIKVLVGTHHLPIDTFNAMIEASINNEGTSERIRKEDYRNWLEVLVDQHIIQGIKTQIAQNPPITYRECLKRNGINKIKPEIVDNSPMTYEECLDLMEQKLFALITMVCNVMMRSFLDVDFEYENCHDKDINSIEIINYFYSGYGRHCVEYCHRIMTKGLKVKTCNDLIDDFIKWWEEMKRQFAELLLTKDTILYLIAGNDTIDNMKFYVIDRMYRNVGGTVGEPTDSIIRRYIENYLASWQIRCNLLHFFNNLCPSQQRWHKSIEDLHNRYQSFEQMDVKNAMKADWSWYTPHREFFEELMMYPDSDVFVNFWYDHITGSTEIWSHPNGLFYRDLDTVEVCLWLQSLQSIHRNPDQKPSIDRVQALFIQKKVSGFALSEAIKSPLNRVAFATKLDNGNQTFICFILEALHLNSRKNATFKWNGLYSMNILKVIYYERIKPSWDLFCDQLTRGECRVYDVQRHFQTDSWNIDPLKIQNAVDKMQLHPDRGVGRSRSNSKFQRKNIAEDIVHCLQCIKRMTETLIVIDAMKVFQGVMSNSKRFDECKEDGSYRELCALIEKSTNGFSSSTIGMKHIKTLKALKAEDKCEQTLNSVLNVWSELKDQIGETPYDETYLQWLCAITANKQFVVELFDLFEDDGDFAGHLKLFQNPDPEKTKRLLDLNFIRKQLVTEIACNISGKTMSQMMEYLLEKCPSEVDVLEALVANWGDILSNNESVTALQFHKDRALLSRLKSFQFEGTDLYIELMSLSLEKGDVMSSEEFMSLHDRLLIYTSSGHGTSVPDHLVDKSMEEWTNGECLDFFEQELKASKTIIDKNDIGHILGVLRNASVNGSKLKRNHASNKEFRKLIVPSVREKGSELFDGDKTKTDIIVTELQKLIQLQVMKCLVEDIIPKFEIAKKIQKERIRYHDQGGAICLEKYKVLDIFKQEKCIYEKVLCRWRFYQYSCKSMITDLRREYPILTYYTMNDMRFICDRFNEWKQDHKESHIQKLTAKFAFIQRDWNDENTRNMISGWDHLDDTVITNELETFLITKVCGKGGVSSVSNLNHSDLEGPRVYINAYLESQSFLRYELDTRGTAHDESIDGRLNGIYFIFKNMNPSINSETTKALLTSKSDPIEPFDERRIFKKLGQYLKEQFEDVMSKEMTPHDQRTKLLLPGKPHLYHVDDVDLVLQRVINLFCEYNQKLHASQILFCSENTTIQDVTCFMARCCHFSGDSCHKIYCLVQPEKLQSHITEEILSVLLKRLRDAEARLTIICADKTNRWFSDLSIYQSELEVLTDNQSKTFYEEYIINFDNDAKSRKASSVNPVCVVFWSKMECAGKTYQIKEKCATFGLECIQIPFNSPTVDRDFVVNRLCDGEAIWLKKKQHKELKNKKLAFHLNISSHAGKDVNELLFQLLILRHITKSNGDSFVVRAHHVFFIELPSQISNTFKKTNIDDVKNHFYFLAGPKSYIYKQEVQMKLKDFHISDEHQFVLKYLDALEQTLNGDKKLLEIQKRGIDWNHKTHPNVGIDGMIKLVTTFTGKERNELNFVFLKSYLDFLYRQFIQLATSPLLIQHSTAISLNLNKNFKRAQYIQYHRVIAASFARNGCHFACENYEIESPFLIQQHKNWKRQRRTRTKSRVSRVEYDLEVNDDEDDLKYERQHSGMEEAAGTESFSLVKKCENADPPIVFLNSGFMAEILEANIEKDWEFHSKYAENTFTLLCKDLGQCQHDDAMEWKEFQKLNMGGILELKENEDKDERIEMESADSQKEKLRLLLRLCGGYRRYNQKEKRFKPVIHEKERSNLVDKLWRNNSSYALTFDNILKIAAIFFRVKAQIPVLIMGETGCGKTRLLKYMADILSMHMITVDVHGGFVMKDLRKTINVAVDDATIEHKGRTVLLFFDEINTSEEISSFKEIICDHSFRGNPLPPNLIIIGALNPYRSRKESAARLKIRSEDAKNNRIYYKNQVEERMSKLVYTVYPLPPSMKRFVWNFGNIQPKDEQQYIAVIVDHEWGKLLNSVPEDQRAAARKYLNLHKGFFAKLIDISQFYVRKWLEDISVCSLRDVRRVNTFFVWFYQQSRDSNPNDRVVRSMVVALAQCFYYRLDFDHRQYYEHIISDKFKLELFDQMLFDNKRSEQIIIRGAGSFKKILKKAQNEYLKILEYPEGIAMNRAFRENIFVILVGILTKTPTIVVGRPGSSKTLAIGILESNLNPASKNKKLSDLGIPDHLLHSVQCSKLTTPDMISKEWESAERAQKFANAPESVFFLDEMGLAEQSDKKPLKVLHNLLEDSKMAFIGLSNWTLDSAKMNRVVLHEVVPIDQDRDDLTTTAKALATKGQGGNLVRALNKELDKLVDFYIKLVEQQRNPRASPFSGGFHFYGARDFYNTIAYLKFCCNALNRNVDEELLLEAICRNFGGLNQQQFDKYIKKLILPTLNLNDWRLSMKQMTAINLIRSNISQSQSEDNNPRSHNYEMRHMMLITDTEVSWKYLYEMDVLQHEESRVIFGSKFKNDQNSSLHLHQQLESIKNAMVSGHTVVLLHLNELYDSLYDVLNQRYLKVGTKRFSKIFIRDGSMTVQIHRSFRFVIVVPTSKAYHLSANPTDHTPVAFLNRLEKQYLSFNNLRGTHKNWDQMLKSLYRRIENLLGEDMDYTQVFAGFIPILTFASVLMYAENMKSGGNQNGESQIVDVAVALLLSNCYLRYFIGHKNLELHRALKLLKVHKRNSGDGEELLPLFSSIQDVMEYFDFTKHYAWSRDKVNGNDIDLIRVTTHDHFQHFSDFAKHFHMRRQVKTNVIGKTRKIQFQDQKEENENQEEDVSSSSRRKIMLVNIDDVISSNGFRSVISEFLRDPLFSTLIIQTTNKNNDEFLHNLHIQYLIEQTKHTAIDDPMKKVSRSKQIVLVIYMNRLRRNIMKKMKSDSKRVQFIQSQQYPLIFNSEWKQVYCDSVLPAEIKIADLNVNASENGSFSDRFSPRIRTITKSVIESAFPMALNSIRFPSVMQREVVRVAKLFEHDDLFQSAIIDRIQEVLSSNEGINAPINVIKNLLNDFGLNVSWSSSWKLSDDQKKMKTDRTIIPPRGSFRQLLIKRISTRMKSELVDVLIAIFDYHSSNLYNGPDLPRSDSLDALASLRSLRDRSQTNDNIAEIENFRTEMVADLSVDQIWLTLLAHKSGIVRRKEEMDQTVDGNRCYYVRDDLKVMFPFSPYIYSYFRSLQRRLMNEEKGRKVNASEDRKEAQILMCSKIRRRLEVMGMDDCLLNIHEHIECYTYDVAALEVQQRFGKRFGRDYTFNLIQFIQRFMLCAVQETHEDVGDDAESIALRRESESMGFPITDDPLTEDEETGDDDEDYYDDDESDDDDDVGDRMAMTDDEDGNESGSDNGRDSADDRKESVDEQRIGTNDNGVDFEDEKEEKDITIANPTVIDEDQNPYPYDMHEIHAALWCNESLLQHLIAIMRMYEHQPQGLQEIVTLCWEDTRRNLTECIFDIMQRVVNQIQDGFQRLEAVLFKRYINEVMESSSLISWVLQWLKMEQFDPTRMSSVDTNWELIELYLLCYKPFYKHTDTKHIKIIKEGLQRLLDEFRNEGHIQFDDNEKLQFIHELIIDIVRNLKLEDEDRSQYVIQQYICHFAFRSFEETGTMLNEEFVLCLVGLMSRQPEEEEDLMAAGDDPNDDGQQYPEFYANNYTKQQISAKLLRYLSTGVTGQQRQSVLQRLDQELTRSPLLCSVLLRAAESELHLKWLKKRAKHQVPTMKAIGDAAKVLKDSEKKSVLDQLLAVAECKVLIHYVVSKMNMKAIANAIPTISQMYVATSSSTENFQSLVKGLGYYFFAEFWRQKRSVSACHLKKQKKYSKEKFLKHIFNPDDSPNDEEDKIVTGSKYKQMGDCIFNLLIPEGNILQKMTANYQALDLTDTDYARMPSDVSECTVDAAVENRFKTISKMLHSTMSAAKPRSIDSELQLESHEVIHLIAALFNCTYLYGGAKTEKKNVILSWLQKQNKNFMTRPSREWNLMIGLMGNSSTDSNLKFNVNDAPKYDHMMQIRLSWHLFGVCCSIGITKNANNRTIRKNPFYLLLTNPLFFETRVLIGMPWKVGDLGVGYIDIKEVDDQSVRGLSHIAVCIIRCFILCTLWLHHSDRSSDFPSNAMKLMYPHMVTDSVRGQKAMTPQMEEDLSIDIKDQIKKYIKKIQKKLGRNIEDTFYVLHAIVHKMYLHHDANEWRVDIFSNDKRARVEFENFFKTHCVDPILQHLDESINNVRSIASADPFKKYWAKRIGMGFNEESASDNDLKRTFEIKYAPHLFLPFVNMTITNFRSYVTANANPAHHPVTCGILNALNDVGLSVFTTQHIPSMISWMKNVHQRLSGRISKKDLEEKDPETGEWKYSAKWLLDTLEDGEARDRGELRKELIGFVNGWNDVAKRVTTNHLEDADDQKQEIDEISGFNDDQKALSNSMIKISPRDSKKGIQPIEVPLKLCVYSPSRCSVMIKAILDHLLSVNQTVLNLCSIKRHNNKQDIEPTALSEITLSSDVVDIDDVELLTIVQECSQQSLEYKVGSKFQIKLSLLERRLYERYIIGRKVIDPNLDDLEFEFAGKHDIQSYIDRINLKYAKSRGVGADTKYFVECNDQITDRVSSRLKMIFDGKIKSEENEEWKLEYIKSAKRGIEQTIISLSRWPSLPHRENTKLALFMKEDLKLYKEEYQFYDQFQMQDLLRLQHCDCLWKLLHRKCTIKEGKWSQLPPNILEVFKHPINDEKVESELRQWVNGCAVDEMMNIVIEWKSFIEEKLTSSDHTLQPEKYTLSLCLNYFTLSMNFGVKLI